MKQGLNQFRQLLKVIADPNIREEVKLAELATYITSDAHIFANEVAAGVEALENIAKLSNGALKEDRAHE